MPPWENEEKAFGKPPPDSQFPSVCVQTRLLEKADPVSQKVARLTCAFAYYFTYGSIFLRGAVTRFGPKKINFRFLFSNNSCMYKEVKFQVSEVSLTSFPSYDIFQHLCHCVSFIELTRNGEEDAQCSYASRYLLDNYQPSHSTVCTGFVQG